MDLRGTVVVVTGASSGFGERAAERFAREGAAVVLAARRRERLEDLAGRIRERGGRALPVATDVRDTAALQRLRDAVEEGFGRCDVLVNNAGVPGGGWFTSITLEQIDRIVETNLLGLIRCTKVFLPMLLERGRGHIVNVGSLSGKFALPSATVYSATKHGVIAFSEALSYELEPKGILVTSVNPFFAATEGFPQRRTPDVLVMEADSVARTIVDVVREGRGPEVNVPRGLAPLQVVRVVAPPLYRRGVRRLMRRFRATPAR